MTTRDPTLAGTAGGGQQPTLTAEHITAYNGYAWNTPLLPIDTMIQAQAGIMSYLDIFWLLGILGLCIWPLALFLPRLPKGAAPAH